MRIVVTGANSFIGREYVKQALSKGFEIIAIVRESSKMKDIINDKLSVVELNMKDYKQISNYIKNVDCLVHFAWEGTRGEDRNNEELQKNNYLYSIDLIKSIIEIGCKRIVLAGSQAEYGLVEGVIDENTESKPNTPYGKYKLKVFMETEQICLQENVDYIESRIFSIYGPKDYSNTLIMSLLYKMKNNLDCEMTECKQLWDYLYIEDAVSAIVLLSSEECSNGIYNLGSGNVRTLKEYVEELRRITNTQSILKYGYVPYPATGMVSINPSIVKISKELNWKPQVSFSDGIYRIIQSN